MGITKLICEKCDYEGENRVDNPKSCPRCKYRFDYDAVKKIKSGVMLDSKTVEDEQ